MFGRIIHYFDKLEDRIRGRLSRYPIIYTLIAGVGIVLFWRGVWITADEIALFIPPQYVWLDGPFSVILSTFVLLITGLFVSFFVSDTVIISGIRQEKKIVEKTESEVKTESHTLKTIESEINTIEHTLQEMNNHTSNHK